MLGNPSLWLCSLAFLARAAARLLSQDHANASLSTARTSPNFVFVLVDDQDLRLDSTEYMPLLKKYVMDEGVSFENHFTTTSVCCPARVALWTGRQPHNTNVTDVTPPYGGYPKFISQGLNDAYLPIWLQEAGYNTYYTGKLFNSHSVSNYDDPHAAGWNGSDFLLDPGTYSYMNPIYQRNHDAPVHHHNVHTSDLLTEKALGFLQQGLNGDKPFFLTVAPIAPHSNVDKAVGVVPKMTEPVPCPRYADRFQNAKIPRTDNFNPKEPTGASWIRHLPYLNESTVDYLDHYYRQRLRALQSVDELVEQLVEALDRSGELENTYIIYSSDNGFHLGQHRLPPGKECGIEEDVRVPLYVRGPGLARGTTHSGVTTHIDLAPTILGMVGAELAAEFDGTPIEALVHVPGAEPRGEHVGIEFWGTAVAEGEAGGFDGRGQIMMPNTTYKALRIVGQDYNLYYAVWCNNEHELYDLKSDPGQMQNLYPAASHQSRTLKGRSKVYDDVHVERLIGRLDALMMILKSCKGDDCARPWGAIHPRGGVRSLADAMNPLFDKFYEEAVRVRFDRCEAGYIIDAEGPQTISPFGS